LIFLGELTTEYHKTPLKSLRGKYKIKYREQGYKFARCRLLRASGPREKKACPEAATEKIRPKQTS